MGYSTLDYRKKENRREAFIQYFAWSLKFGDCDPALWCMNYLNERYEYTQEERIWLCWLYGNTYNLPTAWVLKNEFQDYELATLDRLEWWNSANYKRLRYQVDTRYNKGHLPDMFVSYMGAVGEQPQQRFFENLYGSTPQKSYRNISEYVRKHFYKFGRYTTWFYLQALNATTDIKVEPDSLLLNDYAGSRSHRNGLLYALGMEDQVNVKLTEPEYNRLENASLDMLEELKSRYPSLAPKADFYAMETVLCAFKKLFRDKDSRYLGYYLDRQSEEIIEASKDGWVGIDWDVLWQARQESLDARLSGVGYIDKFKSSIFYNTGEIENIEWLEK